MKLEGAVCIVTGSATGTGAACAIQLARKGGEVAKRVLFVPAAGIGGETF